MKAIIITAIACCMMATMTLTASAKPGDKQQKKEKVSVVLTDSSSKNSLSVVSDTLLNDTVVGTESWGDSDADDRFNEKIRFNFGTNPSDNDMVVAVVAIVSVFGLPLLAVCFIAYLIYRNRRNKYRLAQSAIDKGQEIPAEIINADKTTTDVINSDSIYKMKREAVRRIFIGIGLAVFLGYLIGKLGMMIGLLVVIIGVGKYVVAMMDEKHENQKDLYNKNESENRKSDSTNDSPF
ncbi:MAG: hypothetical protein J6M59_08755 [Bacteroidaceae bacterium]|nr:hypothetical protein [Bacteroidaceae bacterium]MBP3245176.1 hypothetical protein [Bacteroidaceae bacterium]